MGLLTAEGACSILAGKRVRFVEAPEPSAEIPDRGVNLILSNDAGEDQHKKRNSKQEPDR